LIHRGGHGDEYDCIADLAVETFEAGDDLGNALDDFLGPHFSVSTRRGEFVPLARELEQAWRELTSPAVDAGAKPAATAEDRRRTAGRACRDPGSGGRPRRGAPVPRGAVAVGGGGPDAADEGRVSAGAGRGGDHAPDRPRDARRCGLRGAVGG